MADSVALSALRTLIRDRYELDDNYVSDSSLNSWINSSIHELYDLLVDANSDWYAKASSSIAIVAGTSSYAISSTASDFYKLVGVDVLDDSGQWRNMQPFTLAERNRYVGSGEKSLARYRVMNASLHITPTPAWSGSVRIWYLPVAATLSSDGSTFDAINGWEEYVVVDCCIKAAAKEEADASLWAAQKQALIQRIRTNAQQVDDGEPARVRDVDAESRNWWE